MCQTPSSSLWQKGKKGKRAKGSEVRCSWLSLTVKLLHQNGRVRVLFRTSILDIIGLVFSAYPDSIDSLFDFWDQTVNVFLVSADKSDCIPALAPSRVTVASNQSTVLRSPFVQAPETNNSPANLDTLGLNLARQLRKIMRDSTLSQRRRNQHPIHALALGIRQPRQQHGLQPINHALK